MGSHKPKIIAFGIGIAVGTAILIAAIIIGTLLPELAQDQIEAALVTDKAEPEKESFQHWVSDTENEDAAPYYKVYTFFNLTNYAAVQATGAKPVYQAVGPYTYRRYSTKLNYTFPDGGNQVQYSTYRPVVYEPDLVDDSLDPYSDVIYNINPTYVGVIVAAGGEENLIQGLVAPTWAQVMKNVNSQAGYLGLVLDQYFMEYLYASQSYLVSELGGNETALEDFYAIWANATEDPTFPEGFNSTMRLSVNGTASGISLASATLLFDPAQPLGLLSTNPMGFQTWFAAEQGDSTSIGGIQATFGLTSAQMSMVLSWRNRFKPTYYPALSAEFGVSNVSDLGYYQWGMGNLTSVNIATYMAAFATLPETPEFAVWAATYAGGMVFTVDQSKAILTGSRSMLNATNYITFVTLLSQSSFTTIYTLWGLSPQQAGALYGYISGVIIDTYVVQVTLEPIYAEGGGLITWHTVDDWLWNGVDPLLEVVAPSNPYCNLFQNDTSEAYALANNKASLYWTGKSDINKIVEYINFQGDSEIGIWETPQPVGGTDASQFAPDVSKSQVLETYVSDLARIVDLTFEKEYKLKGITLYRYLLADYQLEVDPTFYQNIRGFANMSVANSGAPIFLSKPKFLDCDQYWVDQISGITPSRDDDVVVDVEPITGITMNVHKQLQLNVYYSNDTEWTDLFSVFNPEMTSGLFYPLLWVDETSTITDKQAKDFKKAVYEPLYAFRVVLIVGTIVGGLMAIAFVGLIVYFVKQEGDRDSVTNVIDLAESN